jgi:hypothetical protein
MKKMSKKQAIKKMGYNAFMEGFMSELRNYESRVLSARIKRALALKKLSTCSNCHVKNSKVI